MFQDLKKRLLISSVLGIIIASLLSFAHLPEVKFFLTLVLALFALGGLMEYIRLLRAKGLNPSSALMLPMAFIWIFSIYASILDERFSLAPIAVMGLLILFLFLRYFHHIENALLNIAGSFFGICYVVVPLGLILKILYPSSISLSASDGRMWVIYLIVVTKVSDVVAYFTGKIWGTSKLAKELSPGKTVVGGVSGLIGSIMMSLLFCFLSKVVPSSLILSWADAAILGFLLGIVGQVGDLAESLLKRDAGVKDSNAIPGVGGVLDMLDSLLFTTPIIYVFMKTFL